MRSQPAVPGQRARGERVAADTPHLIHLTPQPLLDPIRQVKRESIHWKRKVFHVMGVGAAAFTYTFTSINALQAFLILCLIAVPFVSLDLLRFWVPGLRKKVKRDFAPFMRDYELDGLSSGSWYLLSGLLAIALFPKVAACLGLVYLAVGDPFASAVGVKWGRIRIPGGKTLEGSLALFTICAAVGSCILVGQFGFGLASAVPLAIVSAAAAAVAEWLPVKKLDDNFVVPLLTAALTTPLLLLLA